MIDETIGERDPLDSQLDEFLDNALESYTPRSVQPGLEYRILASATAANLSWFSSWKPAWALALAALLLVVAALPAGLRVMRQSAGVAQPPAIAAMHLPQFAGESPATSGPVQTKSTAQHLGGKSQPSVAGAQSKLADKNTHEKLFVYEDIGLKPITIAPIQIRELN